MANNILHSIGKYASLVKISHTIFALPFAIIGFHLALSNQSFEFDWQKFLLIILCMVFARNSAMSFNRIADKKYDEKNPRTQNREIPAGKVSVRNAIIFLSANIVLFVVCTYFINPLVFYLSPVALATIMVYSLTKRFTYLCHFVLGLGLSLAPIGAYLVVTGVFDVLPLMLSFAVLFWVAGFDIIYALNDIAFDREHHLKSVPARFGIKKSLIISALVHVVSMVFIIIAGVLYSGGIFFWIGASVFSFFIIYQHVIVKPSDLSRINLAFFTLNGFSSLIFLIFFLLDYYF
ncbi:MAG: UbiA-like polyprenyltransferase [Bacteroidota bacterium]